MPDNLPPADIVLALRLQVAISPERLSSYRERCGGDLVAAIELYRWNSELGGAFWDTLGHVEVLLRNTLSERLASRQERLGRSSNWLDDVAAGLDTRGRDDVVKARRRVQAKKKAPTDGQIISELGFGFWRSWWHVATRPSCGQTWPAGSPTRRIEPGEPWRIRSFACTSSATGWPIISGSGSQPGEQRYEDCLLVAGFIDPIVRDWIAATSPVPVVLARRPR